MPAEGEDFVVKTEFWVDFPMPANEFVTKARLELGADVMRLVSLAEGRVAPLQSDGGMEIPVTVNQRAFPVRVSKDGRVISVKLEVDFEPTDAEESHYSLPKGVVPTAFNYANRFLDIVRFVTGDPAIERVGLGFPQVLVVLSPAQHGMDFQLGLVVGQHVDAGEREGVGGRQLIAKIDTAIGKDEILELPLAERRLSREDIDKVRELCADESALPVWDDLLSSARYSFHHGAYREALLNSHMAIEARVDRLIYLSLTDKDVEQKQAEEFLSDTSFKYKVNLCLATLCGVVIKSGLRERILNLHGRRNEVAHLGAQVYHREASRAVSTARRALAALDRPE
jgi:hypothetical protein